MNRNLNNFLYPFKICLVVVCIVMSCTEGNSQLVLESSRDFNWTGLTFDTLVTGRPGDGVLGSTLGDFVVTAAGNCRDTVYKVTSSLDVTNNTQISWDGTSDATQSFTTEDGVYSIVYDAVNGGGGFISGEDNKITATFSLEQVVNGNSSGVERGIKFDVRQLAATSPAETINIRVFNGTSVVLEQNGITNSNLCAPLAADGTSSGTIHTVEIADGTTVDKVEIDVFVCNDVAPTSIRVEVSQFEVTGLNCPETTPAPISCGAGNSYYCIDPVRQGNSEHWRGVTPGQLHTGKVYESFWYKDSIFYFQPPNDAFTMQIQAVTGPLNNRGGMDPSLPPFKNGAPHRWNFSNAGSRGVYTLLSEDPIENPVIFIYDIAKNMKLFLQDKDGNPLTNFKVFGNTAGAISYDNIITRHSGIGTASLMLMIEGTIEDLRIVNEQERNVEGRNNVNLVNPSTKVQVQIAECLPDLVEERACPLDLYQWKVDTFVCEYLVKDVNDVFYKLNDNRYLINSSIGEAIFQDEPFNGEVTLVQKDVFEACPDDFECPASGDNIPVILETVEPAATGTLLDRIWFDTNLSSGDPTSIGGNTPVDRAPYTYNQSQWDDPVLGPFSGPLDAIGLPTHGANGVASGMIPNFDDAEIGTVGFTTFQATASSLLPTLNDQSRFALPNQNLVLPSSYAKINVQQDGWLVIPPDLTCVEFSTQRTNTAWTGSTAFYVIESDGTPVKVIDNMSEFGNYTGDYCINNPFAEFGKGWRLIRIRFYGHGLGNFHSVIYWNMLTDAPRNIAHVHGDNFTTTRFQDIKSNFLYPADSPESLVPPTDLIENVLSVAYGVQDRYGGVWGPNGGSKPTGKFFDNINLKQYRAQTVLTSCDNQPDPTSGLACEDALNANYCIPINNCEDAIAANADVCAILTENPNHPLAQEDCDGGGQNNTEECAAGQNPSIPSDDIVICDPVSPAPIIGNE